MLAPGWRAGAVRRCELLLSARTHPAINRALARARDRELARGHVAGNGRAGADRRSRANRDRCHQHAVGAHVRIVADDRPVLEGAVVVGDDRAGADVHAPAYVGVADIGEGIGLGALSQLGVFHFDKITDVHVITEHDVRPRARERADAGAAPDRRTVETGEPQDLGPGADHAVAQDRVGSDAYFVAQFDVAFEDTADIDRHVAPDADLTADFGARRISERRARFHQGLRQAVLRDAFDLCQLLLAVDAERLLHIGAWHADDGDSFLHRLRHDIGQVILALRVLVRQAGEPALERRGRRHQDPGVDLIAA